MLRIAVALTTALLVAGCSNAAPTPSGVSSQERSAESGTPMQTVPPQPSDDASATTPAITPESSNSAARAMVTDAEVCEYVNDFYQKVIFGEDSGSNEYRNAADEMRELASRVDSQVMKQTLSELVDAAEANADWYAEYEADPDAYDVFEDGLFFAWEGPDEALDSDFYDSCTAAGYE